MATSAAGLRSVIGFSGPITAEVDGGNPSDSLSISARGSDAARAPQIGQTINELGGTHCLQVIDSSFEICRRQVSGGLPENLSRVAKAPPYISYEKVTTLRHRDLFLDILKQVRAKYDLVNAGYVVMPEHFHLLVSKPRLAKLSTAMQVLKQRVSRRCRGKKGRSLGQMKLWDEQNPPAFWQPRYYDQTPTIVT
jgi:REP element-mobilizing transposase RayT